MSTLRQMQNGEKEMQRRRMKAITWPKCTHCFGPIEFDKVNKDEFDNPINFQEFNLCDRCEYLFSTKDE